MNLPIAVTINHPANFEEWRAAARSLVLRDVAPEHVAFISPGSSADLFGAQSENYDATERVSDNDAGALQVVTGGRHIRVPSEFPQLAKTVICHNDKARFSLLYRLLWRLQDTPGLLSRESDADVWELRRMAKSVRRDMHKMKAFVRFRKIEDPNGEAFVAWFEPEYHIVERTAPFFARRFTGMRWSIVTPAVSAHWNGDALAFSQGATRNDVPDRDALESHWRVYYSSIFNPARLKINAMRAEMPIKYWKNLPESRLIPELTRSAQRAQRAAPAGTAPSMTIARRLNEKNSLEQTPSVGAPQTLKDVARQVKTCTRCHLCEHATQAVPGEGDAQATLMIVGEQPGDLEDLSGRPFAGPAGDVLNAAFKAASIARDRVYLTNAVKHFKHTVRGKRRLHQRPNAGEVEHCRWWLDHERKFVAPRVTLALGATAARAVVGKAVSVTDVRGQLLTSRRGDKVVVTLHPAYVLRLSRRDEKQQRWLQLIHDLKLAYSLAQ